MSSSAIQCRKCDHTLAKRHHTGNIKTDVGIRAVLLKDGRLQLQCPCGDTRVVVAEGRRKAA